MGDLTVTILDSKDLRDLNRAFKGVADGKALRKEFTDGLRGVLKPIVPEVKAAYLAAPSMGHGGMSRGQVDRVDLRALLAKATRVEVKLTGKQAGARIRVDGRKMPNRMKALPRYWEGEEPGRSKGRWRHPTWGNRDVWVQQKPHPRFYAIVGRHAEQAAQAVEQIANRVVAKLERSV
jgi:hypothetical protein